MTEIQMTPSWSVDDLTLHPINQVAVSLAPPAGGGVPDGILIYLGHALPPILLGTEDEVRAQLTALGGELKVQGRGLFLFSRDRAAELVAILQGSIDQYDNIMNSEGVRHV
ncbi:hypothetical protein QE370_000474 [Aeromicrobium sp. SORGH_AS981]|uniref:hypothetical protein n=1 Tax=Aeromicrobium sp. SORGH_AS_0981 TaxID=3041802 RepID=UPI002862BD0F|nr:hypothetical protein [Aeromicrobium sp. SORGH_AS_0981]MDR6117290.1 hypothetical protein [Aeromicrobium sp. SORGH_AS_0981]